MKDRNTFFFLIFLLLSNVAVKVMGSEERSHRHHREILRYASVLQSLLYSEELLRNPGIGKLKNRDLKLDIDLNFFNLFKNDFFKPLEQTIDVSYDLSKISEELITAPEKLDCMIFFNKLRSVTQSATNYTKYTDNSFNVFYKILQKIGKIEWLNIGVHEELTISLRTLLSDIAEEMKEVKKIDSKQFISLWLPKKYSICVELWKNQNLELMPSVEDVKKLELIRQNIVKLWENRTVKSFMKYFKNESNLVQLQKNIEQINQKFENLKVIEGYDRSVFENGSPDLPEEMFPRMEFVGYLKRIDTGILFLQDPNQNLSRFAEGFRKMHALANKHEKYPDLEKKIAEMSDFVKKNKLRMEKYVRLYTKLHEKVPGWVSEVDEFFKNFKVGHEQVFEEMERWSFVFLLIEELFDLSSDQITFENFIKNENSKLWWINEYIHHVRNSRLEYMNLETIPGNWYLPTLNGNNQPFFKGWIEPEDEFEKKNIYHNFLILKPEFLKLKKSLDFYDELKAELKNELFVNRWNFEIVNQWETLQISALRLHLPQEYEEEKMKPCPEMDAYMKNVTIIRQKLKNGLDSYEKLRSSHTIPIRKNETGDDGSLVNVIRHVNDIVNYKWKNFTDVKILEDLKIFKMIYEKMHEVFEKMDDRFFEENVEGHSHDSHEHVLNHIMTKSQKHQLPLADYYYKWIATVISAAISFCVFAIFYVFR